MIRWLRGLGSGRLEHWEVYEYGYDYERTVGMGWRGNVLLKRGVWCSLPSYFWMGNASIRDSLVMGHGIATAFCMGSGMTLTRVCAGRRNCYG